MSDKVIHRTTSIESMAQFSRPIQGIAEGCTVREWKPLHHYWALEGHEKLQEPITQWFLHTPSVRGK